MRDTHGKIARIFNPDLRMVYNSTRGEDNGI